jgi:tetratricopeptide (TPR) repeat protein
MQFIKQCRGWLAILVVRMLVTSSALAQQDFQSFVSNAKYDDAIAFYKKAIERNKENDQARFRLGVAQFLNTFEELGHSWYRYGQLDNFLVESLPLFRLNVPSNPTPEPIDYRLFRSIIQSALDGLQQAESTLTEITAEDVFLELDLLSIRLDWNANQQIDSDDNLFASLRAVLGNQAPANGVQSFVVRFDAADVKWLRGYCHLLMAVCEFCLAYDHQDFWDVAARRIFAKAHTSFEFLNEEPSRQGYYETNMILDLIASIHQLRFTLCEPERMPKVLAHVKKTIQLSRDMWKLVEAETDDDREWIPNPNQKPPFPRAEVSREMIAGWYDFLNEAEAILDGEKLVPFWRGNNPKRGVNLNRFFMSPEDLDIVLWVHGSGAIPFLQADIPVTSKETWNRFERIFRGEFIGFAIWFN